jgi:hypothetical protein
MKDGLTLYDYLGWGSTETKKAVIDIIEGFGYKTNLHCEENLVECIKQFVRREGEKGLMALSVVHPDRDLILQGASAKMGADGNFTFESNQSPWHPVANQQKAITDQQPVNKQDHHNTNSMMILGLLGLAFLTTVIIISKK